MPPKKLKQNKTKLTKQPIPENATLGASRGYPEDFELSDDEPTTINFNEEQKVSGKFITFECPLCKGKLQIKNEIEITPKGVKCSCNPCSFKISKSDKTMNVSKSEDGCITLDSEIHSISFGWNKQVTPPNNDEETRNKMISDVINTPRSSHKHMDDMD